jgi:undecaprenyl-diphosphatase
LRVLLYRGSIVADIKNHQGVVMNLFQAFILGLVQGATEFIPVSSSGHLVLLPWLLGWESPPLAFDTMVHWGTLVAVLAVFWLDLWGLTVAGWNGLLNTVGINRSYDRDQARLAWIIVLGSLPAALAGFLFADFFEDLFARPAATAGLLLVTAGILAISEWLSRQERSLSRIGWLDASVIGVAQAFAIMPGISRSGTTIAAGMSRGVQRQSAAHFSFLLSAPVILGAGLFKLLDLTQAGGFGDLAGALVVGFVTAAVSGYLCIRWLLKYLASRPLYGFAIYCLLFGVSCLVVALFRG